MRRALPIVLWVAAFGAQSQDASDAAVANEDATTLDPVRVTAPRLEAPRMHDPAETGPTVFNRYWHEPFSLKRLGDEGGVVPLLSRYMARKMTQGARRLPGWKLPIQPAVARPPPLDDRQLERALLLQERPPGSD